jgi:hypothetical protein
MFQEDKTLSETEIQHFCLPKWRERVEEARVRGYFTKEEIAEAKDWDTCAVGEARERYAILYKDSKMGLTRLFVDLQLQTWGQGFFNCVEASDFKFADEYLDLIELRLRELSQVKG